MIENLPGQPSSPRMRDYGALILRYKWLLIFFTTLAVLLTYLFYTLQPREFEAKVTLDLDRQAALPGAGSGANGLDEFIATQVQLLQSEPVLRPVTKKYQIQTEDLHVDRIPKTSLVRILYRSPDFKVAGDVVGAVAASYLEMLERNRFAAWSGASALTDAQIADARSRMEQSQEDLLRAQTTGVAPGSASARLQENYARAVADKANREAAYESVKTGSLAALLASADADPVRKLVERKTEALRRFNDLKQLFGENHPDYQQAQAEIRQIDDELNNARQTAVQKAYAQLQEAGMREENLREEMRKSGAPQGVKAPAASIDALQQKADADRSLYQALVRKLSEAQIDARLQNSQVRIVDPVNVAGVNRHLLRNCLLATLILLPLALIVVLVGGADRTLRTLGDLASSGVPVLGVLPSIPAWRESLWRKAQPHLIYSSGPGTRQMSYREAIEQLREVTTPRDPVPLRSIVVVSPLPQEGRSSLAANLAIACSEAGRNVLLVDGDLRNPSLHRLFLPSSPKEDLSGVLRGEVNWRYAAVETMRANLRILPGASKKAGKDPDETILADVLTEAAAEYDLVLVDSASFLHNAESVDFAKHADAVLVEVRAGRTGEDSLLRLLGYLRRLNVKVLGVVLNDA
jgi:Mrp family chromosome partitioning ATPase/uncharacterized protein involved in exopolysaccharide biosynthesis